MKTFAIFLYVVLTSVSVQAQKELDSIILQLNNKDLFVSPKFGGVIFFRDSSNAPPKKVVKRNRNTVSSFNYRYNYMGGLYALTQKYSKKAVAKKLYYFLNDPERDMYVSALLFELLDADSGALSKFIFQKLTRDKWISSGLRDEHISRLRNLFKESGFDED